MPRLMRMTSKGEIEMTQAEHDTVTADRAAWAAAEPKRIADQNRDKLIQERIDKNARDQAEADLIREGTIS